MKNSVFPKFKKSLAFILTFAMLLSAVMTAATFPSAAAAEIWDGTIAESYAGGTGSKSDPYLIANGSQLALMINEGDNSKGKFYKITEDIYLNNTTDADWAENNPKQWFSQVSIGNKYFQGSLNGAGHYIRGLYYNGSANYVALIPAAKGTVAVNDIQIAESHIESSGFGLASVIGRAGGGNLNAKKCYIHENVTVKCTDETQNNAAGGIFGYGGSTTYVVEDCAVLSTRTSVGMTGKVYTGAMVANAWGSSVKVSNTFAKGVFGNKNPGTPSVENCYTSVEDNVYNTEVCSLENMMGENAKTNMSKLDWEEVWEPTEGYPIYKTPELYPDGVVGAVWDGKIATGYAGGSGTENDPYIIETARQLAYLVKNDIADVSGATNGKYYKLAADIYLNDVSDPDWRTNNPNSWYEVVSTKRFGGNLDGDGHTVYGLYYNGSASFGLIPWIEMWTYDVTIKNLVISDAYINTSGQFVGAIMGYVYANSERGATLTVSNCFVDDNVYICSTNDNAYIGGIAGCLKSNAKNTYNFTGCASLADVRHGGGNWKMYAGIARPEGKGEGTYNINNCFAFPNLAHISGKAIESTGSYGISSQEALLTIIGESAKTAMPDFDWENGAFAPTQNGYPRLKIVSQRMGDINGDDKCNSEDLTALKKQLLGIEQALVSDINSDGEQNILDLISLKKKAVAFNDSGEEYVPAGYSLVWKDEFKGRTIDNSKWRTDQARMHGTNELGNFDDNTVRSVGNGKLLMTAYKNPDLSGYNGAKYITTNSITTENRMSFRYGYLEVKAKVPYKEGCWPSLWLRSPNATQTDETGKDDYNMEVDIIEPFGYTDQNGTTIHETSKTASTDHCQTAVGNYKFKNAENLANEYHTYGFLWTEDEMKFYIDGECFATYNKATLERLGYKSDFDDTVNILFNNHLFTASSDFSGNTEDNIIENYEENLPAEFSVEYVRLYQKQGDVLVLETPAEGE